ncbi:28S ribosomal protein S35, mitochondrial [Condylostylus longicornis]|uniref:28S ribosomal protein S35, mitochondrial n=1 Tax=Condylostylus longicornis TaxID=2530218 RepID=UPI00244E2F1E|nr:28S ribosomal protein S35, mitochondrial [Condylostylus longicornis]
MQRKIFQYFPFKSNIGSRRAYSEVVEDDFRVLNLRAEQTSTRRLRKQKKVDTIIGPRTDKMSENQDWTSVWPGSKTFHPSSVPLPLRQGFNEKGAPPSKFANAELMKIPNFLHLTPLAIKKHCEAIKPYCTQWPKEIPNEKEWKDLYPIEVITSDYCHGLPTIRNPLSRIVTLKIKMSSLKFDARSKDKFLRLLGEHYNPDTDIITITSDRCPAKIQNFNFCLYILTACYFESHVSEPWENLKQEKDMISYEFSRNKSKETIEKIIELIKKNNPTVIPKITLDLAKSIENFINDVECEENIVEYKNEVKKLLGV